MIAARKCDADRALAKARLLYGTGPRYVPATPAPTVNIQSESQLLAKELAACPPFVRSKPTTESARVNTLVRGVLDAEPRFKEFVRFFPVPCAPVGADVLNASMPKASTACQLPNSHLFPIFPA
jgi:hypothetical protein